MRKTLAFTVATVALAGACSKGPVQTVRVSFTGTEYSYQGPVTIEGGRVEFSFANRGRGVHQAQLLKLASTLDPPNAIRAIRENRAGGLPDGITGAGGTQEVFAGVTTTFTVNLASGPYLLLCFAGSPPNYTRGMAKPLEVTEGRTGPLPAAAGTFVGREFSFDVPALAPGKQVLAARNDGPTQPHQFSLLEYPKGQSVARVQGIIDAYLAGRNPKGAPTPRPILGFGIIGPGRAGTFETTFRKGRAYVLLCSLSAKGSDRPNYLRGMVEVFGVP